MVILEEGTNMYKYEKVEHDNELPTKLHDFYIEDNIGEPIEKHWHRSIEILIPLYGSFILWINGNKVKITAGNIYIINSQDIHAIQAIEGERIYKGYALQIKYDYLRESYHDIDKIYFCYSEDEKNYVKTDKDTYYTSKTLYELLEKTQFFRCHRSYIVNLNRIKEVYSWFNGTYKLIIDDKENTEVPVSRLHVKEIKQILGI